MTNQATALKILDQLIALDQQTGRAFYEMGQLLYSIKQGKLWQQMGYESFMHMVEEELSFSVGTAHSYATVYAHFKRLGYTTTEAHDLLYTFGLRRMREVLPGLKQKAGSRAISTCIEERDRTQMTFWLSSQEKAEVLDVLCDFGAIVPEDGVNLMHSSEAFMDVIRAVKARTRKAA